MCNNAVPELVKKRIEIAKLFYPLERKLQRRLAKRLISGFNETANYLSGFAKEIGFIQKIDEENFIVWKNNNKSKNECLFCYIEDSAKLELFTELFKK